MKPRFVIRLVVFVGLFILFFVGLFSQQTLLMMSYMCLIPFAGIALGRASVGMFKSARIAVLSEREAQMLRQARTRSS